MAERKNKKQKAPNNTPASKGMSKKDKRETWRNSEIKSAEALTKAVEHRANNPQHRSLDGAPENLDVARMLPHLRTRPFSQRPPWVEARAMQMGEG